jgi:hypothetical protein
MKTDKPLKPALAMALLSGISGAAVAAGGVGVLKDPGPVQRQQFDS